MATESIHLMVEGSKQGVFPGDDAGGTIVCTYYGHRLELPYDPRAGLMMLGKRQHTVVAIRKPLNAASLHFAQALVSNEVLKTITIRLLRAGDPYFTMTLSNARVMSIEHRVSDLQPTGRDEPSVPVEEITFMFQRIEWSAAGSGLVVGDEWSV